MGARQMGNWLVVVLVALNLLVLLGVFQIWWSESGQAPQPAPLKALEIPVAPLGRNTQGLSEFREVSARSLFSQDRTGPTDDLTPRQEQVSLEGKLLVGTMIIGDQRVALIGGAPARKPKDVTVEAVRPGEQWEGFQVIEVTRDSVVFQGKQGKTVLNFPD